MNKKPILKVENLGVSFSQYTQGLRKRELSVITNLDIELYEGEILAVVGSSGSGKSLLAHAILGILPDNANADGKMYYKEEELTEAKKELLRGKEIAFVPQSVNFLDPLQKVGKQIKISLQEKDREKKNQIVRKLLNKYKLSDEVENYYPHQLSGGMARKVLLNTALATDCKVIIADEPTPGLDEESLGEVLKDFREVADSGKAVLMITHDIDAAFQIADKIAIFYAGTTLEIANVQDFEGEGVNLRHPYTKALLKALPSKGFVSIEGTQPLPGELPEGCLFYDRCHIKTEKCKTERPEFKKIRDGKARCIHAT